MGDEGRKRGRERASERAPRERGSEGGSERGNEGASIGMDDDGNILIAEDLKGKINISKNDGSLVNLNIPALGQRLQCARIFGDKLFVMYLRQPMQVFKINW